MKKVLGGMLATAVLACGQSPALSGTGLFVAPSSVAYADLTNAADKILKDVKTITGEEGTVVIYDQQTFAAIPYYGSAVDLIKHSMGAICKAEGTHVGHGLEALSVAPIDLGGAASGLAALIGVTLPNYAIQGQALTFSTPALIGAFAAESSGHPRLILPAYLLPATSGKILACGAEERSDSVSELWASLSAEAAGASKRPDAGKSPLKDALAEYGKLRDVFLASDKGAPLLGKLLIVEQIGKLFSDPEQAKKTAVLDVALDAAGIDSTTRTILWWRSTEFSANVLAHYYVLQVSGSGVNFQLTLKQPGTINILTQHKDAKSFKESVDPMGKIN